MKREILICVCALTVVASSTDRIYACCEVPVADFSVTDYICVDCEVSFDASASYDPDGTDLTYSWNFGSGAYDIDESDPVNPTCKYSSAGVKTIILEVTDNDDPDCCDGNPDCSDKDSDPNAVQTLTVVEVNDVFESGTTEGGPLYVCLGDSVDLEAIPNPSDASFPSGEPQWTIESQPTGADASLSPSSGSETSTLSDLTEPGDYVVKAKCGDSDTGDTITVTAVEVESLLPDEGTELDDGDGDPNTKLFVVCIVPPTPASSLTVTATPNPSVAEADLPDCWTLTGGTGTGKLTRTVSKNTAGETVITCTCTDSEKETTIWVVRGQVNLLSTWECDGEQADVDIIFTPTDVEDHITDVDWDSIEPTGVTNFGSPSGADLTFSQRSADITEWRIDNARWYSNQADHCNDDADWEIEATYEIGGSHTCDTNYDPSAAPVVFTASAAFGTCLDGEATVNSTFSGAPTYTTTFNGGTGLWETTVAVGTFVRNVQASCWWQAPANSQFHDMVRDEEQYHEQSQMENAGHARWGTAFLVANIMTPVQASQPYTHAIQAQSLALAVQAFNAALAAEEARSWAYLNQQAVICADETEAKGAAGSTHKLAMPCTYPNCP
jgi:hypothetical protein